MPQQSQADFGLGLNLCLELLRIFSLNIHITDSLHFLQGYGQVCKEDAWIFLRGSMKNVAQDFSFDEGVCFDEGPWIDCMAHEWGFAME